MQGNIEKTAKNEENYKSKLYFFKSARIGFSYLLKELKKEYPDYTLLIPSYIGYSPNEGSGIFDPIVDNDINYMFYPVDSNIYVDINEYKKIIDNVNEKIVLLIVHYFGYVDKNIDYIINYAREKDAFIIEDCAHALYSDFIDHSCGHFGDASIYSLHKMLPYVDGGMLRLNNYSLNIKSECTYDVFDYDLFQIANKRKQLASLIDKELQNVSGVRILRPFVENTSITPQTYPIILENYDKNQMYKELNSLGFGVVSLYHTMIEELKDNKVSVELGQTILNLPVHQDASEEDIINMCFVIKKLIRGVKVDE